MDAERTASLDQQAAARTSRRRRGLLWRITREALPAWLFFALIAAWWAAVFKVPAFLLPPSRIRG